MNKLILRKVLLFLHIVEMKQDIIQIIVEIEFFVMMLIVEIEFFVMMPTNEERKLLHMIMSLNICAISNAVKKMGILHIVDRILCIWKIDNEKRVLQIGV